MTSIYLAIWGFRLIPPSVLSAYVVGKSHLIWDLMTSAVLTLSHLVEVTVTMFEIEGRIQFAVSIESGLTDRLLALVVGSLLALGYAPGWDPICLRTLLTLSFGSSVYRA